MKRIKLILFPSFVQEQLDNKAIRPEELMDVNKISAILSDYSVVKILYLNNHAHSPQSSKAIDIFNLHPLNDYVLNNHYGKDYDGSLPVYTVKDTLHALTRVGDEAMLPALEKQLHNYHLPFKHIRIAPKTYALIFGNLQEVSSPSERNQLFVKDMEDLLSSMSLDLTDKELFEEDMYASFLQQLASLS